MARDPLPLLVDGVLLRREALDFGVDDDDLTKAVREGALVRVRQGAYADRRVWDRLPAQERLLLLKTAVIRMYGGGLISHDSAVVLHGGPDWGLDLEHLHLTRPDGTGRTQARIVHHRGVAHPTDLHLPGGGSVTSVARTVVETTIRADSVELGVVLGSHFLRTKQVNSDELRDAHTTALHHRGGLVLTPALALADPRLGSVLESRCWYMFHRHGLRGVIPQYPVVVMGELFFLDFAIPKLGVWVETDGKEKYVKYRRPGESIVDTVRRERRREILVREKEGLEPVRFDWWDMGRPEECLRRIYQAAQRRAA
ncbi:hypothetical protein D9V37_11260 [Nocardioides mangrovicus]|uniref:Type IV toxin-antitoxin system AbiEi family antitoxin domain-containing protein n=1 Tax=Nocardioides mangrovicus TaxID=2478913 RepID=A0A3L8P1V3_9ACTN|nr:type IV toxin-antitoxin system AbiEi family antitoxin domain-containing protein [Nocardioides mangrovicus]RLV49134.1 hypothetical protein D9V37_11260 [Nocardioides mangrovicus]